MLTLQNILRLGGIPEAAKVKLFRHKPKEGPADAAWKDGWLHEYERMHAADFRVPEYTATFIPVAGDARSVRFLWVKRVDRQMARSQTQRNPHYPFQEHYSPKRSGIALDLTRVEAFNGLYKINKNPSTQIYEVQFQL